MFSPDWAPIMLQTPWIWSCPLLSRHADITYCWWAEIPLSPAPALLKQNCHDTDEQCQLAKKSLIKSHTLAPSHLHTCTRARAHTRTDTYTHTHTLRPINPKGNQKYITAAATNIFHEASTCGPGTYTVSLWRWLACPSPTTHQQGSVKTIFHILTNKYWNIATNSI